MGTSPYALYRVTVLSSGGYPLKVWEDAEPSCQQFADHYQGLGLNIIWDRVR